MSYAGWKEWIDDQTINAALVNGAGRELDDCVIGIGADGTGTGPLYIDGNTLKCYTFSALVDGYFADMAANSDLGAGSAGVNYVHLAYVETSDAGVEGRAAGSKSFVAFSLVLHTTTNTPSDYDGSMVLGYATDAVGDNTWTLLTCHDNKPTFIRGLMAPTFDGRDVSADGANLDKSKLFYASANSLAAILPDQTWGSVNNLGWKFNELAGTKAMVNAVVHISRKTPDAGG